ncbi:MAG: glucokinase [Nanoarchaeota archaeon]|nr:glucokinase [Nanoarchaeota archaeon]
MQFVKNEYKKFSKKEHSSFILGCDIGGTNTNLGIFGIKKNFPELLVSLHFKSRELKALHHAVHETLAYVKEKYKIRITKACIAVAGVLSPNKDYAKITNVKWDVSKKVLLKKSKLKKIFLINDFESIGYGINMLTKRDVIVVKKAKKIPKAPILVVGAGTGLGKATLIYDKHYKSYIPFPSEAGHSDFPAQNIHELELVNFIKKYKRIRKNVPYEEILSGQGLSNIYLFLRKTKQFKETSYSKEVDKSGCNPEIISKYRKTDEACKETFKIFKNIYAKFAKNLAIDCLAYGGVYIAGGIAAKNKDIFDKEFVKEFKNNYKMWHLLKKIPIYVILNYNAGLLGAGFFGAKHFEK